MSADPLTANGYSYAGNDSADHADPTGQYRDDGFRAPGSAYGNDGLRERWDNANQHRNSFGRGGGGVYLAPPRAPSGGGCWIDCNGTVSPNPVSVKKPCGWSCKVGKVGGFLKETPGHHRRSRSRRPLRSRHRSHRGSRLRRHRRLPGPSTQARTRNTA
ncbi:hypothetical protein ACQEU6_02200 [Spirillospora sp. CA-108201]